MLILSSMDGRFWTGSEWSPDRSMARKYTDVEVTRAVMARLAGRAMDGFPPGEFNTMNELQEHASFIRDVVINKEPDLPGRLVQVTLGGRHEVGFYLTFRGDLVEVKQCLEVLLGLLQQVQDVPPEGVRFQVPILPPRE